MAELRKLVPPPTPRALGGENADDNAYSRFLSVADWDPAIAAPMIAKDFAWRKKVKPRRIRPEHLGLLCRQHAWRCVLMGSKFQPTPLPKAGDRPLALDPPHNCPPLQRWRTTRHGLPVTYFQSWMWRPDLASKFDFERHIAYHMDHFVRRMNRARGVSRICIIFDMSGFESWMLSYIKTSVDILRLHYPGRAGAMCFINCPSYFLTLWKIISPWLDDEIRSKTFFAPKSVDDGEKAIAYLNKMKLKVGPV